MSGRHEKAAVSRLQAVARIPDFGTAQDAMADLFMAADVLSALKASGNLLLACEAMAEMGNATCKALRAAMAEVMADTGATAVDLPHHRVSLVDGKASVVITDEAAIPAQFMEQPPPKPNKDAIAAALKAGPVPGAMLSNGGQHIRIVSRGERG